MSDIFGIASPDWQKKIDLIYAQAAEISQVVNPGHKPESTNARDTTRTPTAVNVDIANMKDIIAQYDAAVRAATGCPFLQDGRHYDSLHYKLSHYLYEHKFAVAKGN